MSVLSGRLTVVATFPEALYLLQEFGYWEQAVISLTLNCCHLECVLSRRKKKKRWICLTENVCAYFLSKPLSNRGYARNLLACLCFLVWVLAVWILGILVRGVCRSMHVFKCWQEWPQFCAHTVMRFWADALLPWSDLEHGQNKLRSESNVRCQQKWQFPTCCWCQQKRLCKSAGFGKWSRLQLTLWEKSFNLDLFLV